LNLRRIKLGPVRFYKRERYFKVAYYLTIEMTVILALSRWRQEHEFEFNLGYTVSCRSPELYIKTLPQKAKETTRNDDRSPLLSVRWRDSIRKGNHNITFVTLVYLGTPVSR
jgi:hypothetical protein